MNVLVLILQATLKSSIKSYYLFGSFVYTTLALFLLVRMPRAIRGVMYFADRQNLRKRHFYYAVRLVTIIFNVLIGIIDMVLLVKAIQGAIQIKGLQHITDIYDQHKTILFSIVFGLSSLFLGAIIDIYLTIISKQHRDDFYEAQTSFDSIN
eukprot:CAMPEP_0170557452 /NCGR_PEP_ID=MMETSP0211-20121228/25880_1 /TAXON_ID=311385 /ORGANISM="Pseudokeronopsis sp., Strain OXSARD2" /LENGTH=151 /DNA_ID=CAMNT_0010868497 /DNA_START=14 /DNA_END=469 /DNA_ORIENTATION=+